MRHIVKIGFWDTKQNAERTEEFHINKSPSMGVSISRALKQASKKFKSLVQGVEPFFVEKTYETIDAKAVVFETEQLLTVCLDDSKAKEALEAMNLYKPNEQYTIERQTYVKIVLKVTEDGKLYTSINREQDHGNG